MTATIDQDRPRYDYGAKCMLNERARRAADFAQQILATAGPFLSPPPAQLRVLDAGCGYGYTAVELAKKCAHVVGIEPNLVLFEHAARLKASLALTDVDFRHQAIEDLEDEHAFNLVVLDNVFEHLSNQSLALQRISRCLRPNGVLLLIVPNKLWPIEVHYGLPFLSYLPLPLANCYLRVTGRGLDYTDASYAPTFRGLNRLLSKCPELAYQYVLPANIALATMGTSLHYRLGVAALRRWPCLWPLAKVFVVVAVKRR